ncbi:quinone-dependent dihydroorotate dehydrogenase [Kytococcus sedentarius]|uniref:quinone-dependent dihydroorotate dehydrogenase n=1 Tax=Kytococcus sedentarius TaxID=1276 RepID=UPI0035BC7A87
MTGGALQPAGAAAVREQVLRAGYEHLARPVLFRLGGGDAETAHHTTLQWAAAAARVPGLLGLLAAATGGVAPGRPAGGDVECAGIRFGHRVGLAAGVDKDGIALLTWQALGLGHVELGTVTPRPQPGNPRPRVHRLRASGAVLNAMGFPNEGVEAAVGRLREARGAGLTIPVGLSIGKNKDTPLERALDDYTACVRVAAGLPDYLAVNISSPNTPGLRGLQDPEPLRRLLAGVVTAERERAEAAGGAPVPVLCKVAPDMDDAALRSAAAIAQEQGVAGIIATNTTLRRDGLAPDDRAWVGPERPGGVSGAPLTTRAREVVALVRAACDLPVIGVGGVMTPEDGVALHRAGADLVQVYTGFIYAGPALVSGVAART